MCCRSRSVSFTPGQRGLTPAAQRSNKLPSPAPNSRMLFGRAASRRRDSAWLSAETVHMARCTRRRSRRDRSAFGSPGARSSSTSGRTHRGSVIDNDSLDRQQSAVTRESRTEGGQPPPSSRCAIAECGFEYKVDKRTAQVAIPAERVSAVTQRLGKQT